ncbi:VOC family protein [Kitasatospora sp. NBC_01287]|uniref:VOC family protein n=1 Tax=Kitasatospora sp. NBC_01287 TaxID=2903573 RepID=UPI00224E6C5F|nr:VOC family protein [Kitasatospora sp. NBC_01287]MCX4746229.1 VOC family protein [Kitasatospora sp. NBC_01287]
MTTTNTGGGAVPARISIITLGVADLARSSAFYEALGWPRASASSAEIVWFRTADSVLGLFPADELAADAGIPPIGEPAFRGVTMGINLESERAVDEAMTAAVAAGASVVKPPKATSWGGYSGYFEDPDGHLWELAHAPGFAFSGTGQLVLP